MTYDDMVFRESVTDFKMVGDDTILAKAKSRTLALCGEYIPDKSIVELERKRSSVSNSLLLQGHLKLLFAHPNNKYSWIVSSAKNHFTMQWNL